MSKKTSRTRQLKRRSPLTLRVPGWYYAVLLAIALVGVTLIVYSMQNPTINVAGMTSEGDFPRGAADAKVTIFEWGSFT